MVLYATDITHYDHISLLAHSMLSTRRPALQITSYHWLISSQTLQIWHYTCIYKDYQGTHSNTKTFWPPRQATTGSRKSLSQLQRFAKNWVLNSKQTFCTQHQWHLKTYLAEKFIQVKKWVLLLNCAIALGQFSDMTTNETNLWPAGWLDKLSLT